MLPFCYNPFLCSGRFHAGLKLSDRAKSGWGVWGSGSSVVVFKEGGALEAGKGSDVEKVQYLGNLMLYKYGR